MQTEIRSYSDAVKTVSASTAVNEGNLKNAVRDAIEEEDRTRNLVIYGLDEEAGELLSDKVSQIFEELHEKPHIETCRIGRLTAEKSVRPVKVMLSSYVAVRQILSKAKNLRKVDRFKSVYVCPDRTLEERKIQKQLVLELKQKKSSIVLLKILR